jgi:arylsulfatase A-like enzyme
LELLLARFRGASVDVMPRTEFRTTVTSLWFRLVALGIIGLVFAEALRLAQGEVQGWTFYLKTAEVIFEIVVRFVAAALAGIVAGTLCTALVAPFLWHYAAARDRIASWAIKGGVILVVFLDSRYALLMLLHSWRADSSPALTNALLTAHFLLFVAILWIPRTRERVVTSIEGALADKMTRRTAIATVVGAAGLVATEFALSKTVPVVRAALAPQRPKSNVLMITFDALAAEDMSVYGYRLPTTPNIDAFARNATVFKNFYSASTFTTPSIAAMLTGLYPSESRVFQIIGRVQAEDVRKSLPHQMRAGGFATGAFLSNPYAYYLVDSLRSEYDFLPEPTFQKGGLQYLWDATASLHQHSGIGNRMDEYNDLMTGWNFMGGLPLDLFRRYPATESFAHGAKILDKLPDGFFLWIHVMTPHSPYHPQGTARGAFLPEEQLRKFEDEGDDGARRWFPTYPPNQQPEIDLRRLAYDEFILTADRLFGDFMADFEKSGRAADTTVIVSADHGESFEGGIYQHENQYQTRPEIHIPLIVRTPGQQQGRSVSYTADQTALAPTILELAGQPKPEWMPGKSLVPWMTSAGNGEGEGMAFCQFLETNSIFKPLHYGTVGVIAEHYQYVVLLSSQRGVLRPLHEAQSWTIDRSAEHPERAAAMRAAIASRFPGILQTPA